MSKKNTEWRSIVNFCAFIAIVMIGICLILAKLGVGGEVAGALHTIAICIAYIVTAISGWFYIRNRKNVWIWVAYFVALVLIILSFVI